MKKNRIINTDKLFRRPIKSLLKFVILLSAIFNYSCSAEDPFIDDNLRRKKILIGASIYKEENKKRIAGSGFESGDRIGVYVVDNINGNPGTIGLYNNAINIQHMYDGNNWKTMIGEELYWTNPTTNADIYAYYPYDSEMSKFPDKINLSAYPYKVNENQQESFTTNDFLWAKATNIYPTEDKINLSFSHSLSKIKINLTSDTELPENVFSSLLIHNLRNNSSININTGTATVSGQATVIVPYKEINAGNKTTFHAIIIPQSIVKGTPLFSIEINGEKFIFEIDSDLEFKPQKEYQFDLTINETNIRTHTVRHNISKYKETTW